MALTLNGSTGISGVNGSASAPSVVGSDSNTGFSFASDTIAFNTGGSERCRVDSGGRLLIGTTTNSGTSSIGDDIIIGSINDSTSRGLTFATTASGSIRWADAGDNAMGRIQYDNSTDAMTLHTSNAVRMEIDANGNVFAVGIYNATTGSSADGVVVSSGGKLRRVTSSQRYKTSVETLEDKYADAILEARPVWYKSLCEDDNKDYGHWGFIAEEIEKIDPRLCAYKSSEIVIEDGAAVEKKLDTPIVESVQYERFVPHLINLVKRQDTRIKALETKVAALEAA